MPDPDKDYAGLRLRLLAVRDALKNDRAYASSVADDAERAIFDLEADNADLTARLAEAERDGQAAAERLLAAVDDYNDAITCANVAESALATVTAEVRAKTIEEAAKVADREADGRARQAHLAKHRNARAEERDFETMAIACHQVAAAIRTLSEVKQ